MVPFKFAIEMGNRGWILRNTIIWNKPNVMPTSAKDRFTVDFEYLFFFVKNKKYWFEQQFEPIKIDSIKRRLRGNN
jgi:site-specific DNA-methyltransferase (adenine-specific)